MAAGGGAARVPDPVAVGVKARESKMQLPLCESRERSARLPSRGGRKRGLAHAALALARHSNNTVLSTA